MRTPFQFMIGADDPELGRQIREQLEGQAVSVHRYLRVGRAVGRIIGWTFNIALAVALLCAATLGVRVAWFIVGAVWRAL